MYHFYKKVPQIKNLNKITANMETIVIQVSEYYNKPKYYGFMPEVMFNALESAFINDKETQKGTQF